MTLLADPPPAATTPPEAPAPAEVRGGRWHAALGFVPLERIILTPPPGTAKIEDAVARTERHGPTEWINGTLVEKAMGFGESEVGANLSAMLLAFVKPRKLGKVAGADATMRMIGGNMREPDVVFVSNADLPPGGIAGQKVPRVPPTLAVEILSEDNTPEEMRLKLGEFFASGCRLAWVIDPRQRVVRVHTAPDTFQQIDDQATLDGGDVLPGFGVKVADLLDV